VAFLNSIAWLVIQTAIRCRSLRCLLMYLTAYIARAPRSLLVSRLDHNPCDTVYFSQKG
jgi:hypothetical protein